MAVGEAASASRLAFRLETAGDNNSPPSCSEGCSPALMLFTIRKLFLPPSSPLSERVLFREMEEARLSNLDNCNYTDRLFNCLRVTTCKIDAWRQLAIAPSVFVANYIRVDTSQSPTLAVISRAVSKSDWPNHT